MQQVIQVSKLRSAIFGFLSVMTAALLFSCTKNVADVPIPANEEVATVNASYHQSNRTSITDVPFENTLFVPCANGGAGEYVSISGETNFVYQIAWNDQSFHLSYQSNDHNVTGIGLASAENFVGSGGSHDAVMGSWVNGEFISNLVQETRLIGQNTKFTIRYKLHLVILSNGDVTVNIREQTADCN
jgi:hypothetical protein